MVIFSCMIAYFRVFSNVFQRTRILPMGLRLVPMNNLNNLVLMIKPMRILVRLVLNWKLLRENLNFFCHRICNMLWSKHVFSRSRHELGGAWYSMSRTWWDMPHASCVMSGLICGLVWRICICEWVWRICGCTAYCIWSVIFSIWKISNRCIHVSHKTHDTSMSHIWRMDVWYTNDTRVHSLSHVSHIHAACVRHDASTRVGRERHDSSIRETWLIHTCDMTHPYVRHGSFICETWLIHTWDITHSYVRHGSFTRMWDMTHSYVKPGGEGIEDAWHS